MTSMIDRWLSGEDFTLSIEPERYLPAIIYPNLLPDFTKPRLVTRFKEVRKIVNEMQIDTTRSLAWKAACLLLFIIFEGNLDIDFLYRHSKFHKRDCKKIMANWIKNEIFIDGQFNSDLMEHEIGDAYWMTEFTLLCLAGSGELVRYSPKD